MTDIMQDRNNEESFWDDVDALRAMLDAEDAERKLPDPMEEFSAASFREKKAAAPQQVPQYGQDRPRPSHRLAVQQPVPERHRAAPRQQKPVRQRAAGRRDSKGLVITLYVIIAAELAGILAVGAQWYLWMK